MSDIYDLVIIGTGPAGYTAAIYASRYKMKTLVLGYEIGGTAAKAHNVCNYPGFESIKGFELMDKFQKQVEALGTEVKFERVLDLKKKEIFEIETAKEKYLAKNVLIATGTKRRKLGIENEGKFLGKGVSYCATCDGPFFKDKVVGVVGGSDGALTSALMLSEYATKVYIIYRKGEFRAEPAWIEAVDKHDKIEYVFNSNVVGLVGENLLEEVELDSGDKLKLDGLFVEIGGSPENEFLKSLKVDVDNNNYILTNECKGTNIEGLFAAGDCVRNNLKQIITAASDGAIAAYHTYKRINSEWMKDKVDKAKKFLKKDGHFEITAGAAVGGVAVAEVTAGAITACSAGVCSIVATTAFVCPLCVIAAPLLIGYGLYKKKKKN